MSQPTVIHLDVLLGGTTRLVSWQRLLSLQQLQRKSIIFIAFIYIYIYIYRIQCGSVGAEIWRSIQKHVAMLGIFDGPYILKELHRFTVTPCKGVHEHCDHLELFRANTVSKCVQLTAPSDRHCPACFPDLARSSTRPWRKSKGQESGHLTFP